MAATAKDRDEAFYFGAFSGPAAFDPKFRLIDIGQVSVCPDIAAGCLTSVDTSPQRSRIGLPPRPATLAHAGSLIAASADSMARTMVLRSKSHGSDFTRTAAPAAIRGVANSQDVVRFV
jgi:hypothetical protein